MRVGPPVRHTASVPDVASPGARTTGRRVPVVGILLVLLLAAGGAGAVLVGGGATGGPAPGGSARSVVGAGVGSDVVELSADAVGHPLAAQVRTQLQEHFGAINTRNYERWRGTVVQERIDALPELEWRNAYRTTRDGTLRVDRIDDLPDGSLLVRVRFVSLQDLENAPADLAARRICWRGSVPMTDTPPRIAVTQGGSTIAVAC